MRALLRPAFTALSVACLLSAASLASSHSAFAQAKQQPAPPQAAPAQEQQPTLKQIALTDKQIESVLDAQRDMDAVTAKLPENAAPDQKVMAQLDAAAKKHGFASYEDYN